MRLFPIRFSSANFQKLLDYYSQYNPTPMSIKQFIDFGKFDKSLKRKAIKNLEKKIQYYVALRCRYTETV